MKNELISFNIYRTFVANSKNENVKKRKNIFLNEELERYLKESDEYFSFLLGEKLPFLTGELPMDLFIKIIKYIN